MGIRLRVHDGEPIGHALRRFKKLLERSGTARAIRAQACASHVPATGTRRTKQYIKRLKAREATLAAQCAGVQPVASLKDAHAKFKQKTGKR
ncbi:MAG: ribosomal protein S21/MRP21 [Planctomycetes bacterium]|nr:ribosomal protein S21/MRP21 [Planctomycetota bacterium]